MTPFDDDNRDADFRRPPVTIRFTDMATGEELETIEIPALTIPRAELAPEWFAAPDEPTSKPAIAGEETNND